MNHINLSQSNKQRSYNLIPSTSCIFSIQVNLFTQLNFQDFPTLKGSLLLAMDVSIYLSVSHALLISETSESDFWNILENSTATV